VKYFYYERIFRGKEKKKRKIRERWLYPEAVVWSEHEAVIWDIYIREKKRREEKRREKEKKETSVTYLLTLHRSFDIIETSSWSHSLTNSMAAAVPTSFVLTKSGIFLSLSLRSFLFPFQDYSFFALSLFNHFQDFKFLPVHSKIEP